MHGFNSGHLRVSCAYEGDLGAPETVGCDVCCVVGTNIRSQLFHISLFEVLPDLDIN